MNKTNHTFITGKAESPSMMVIGLHILKMNNSPQAGNLVSYLTCTLLNFKRAEMAPKYFPGKKWDVI